MILQSRLIKWKDCGTVSHESHLLRVVLLYITMSDTAKCVRRGDGF